MQDALGLKVSQFVRLMGDREQTESDALLAQSEAHAHISRVIEQLKAQYAEK